MYIGTIHSYCRYLLGAIDARYRQFDVLDENGLTLYLVSRYPKLGIHSLRHAWSSGSRPAPYFATINHVAKAWTMANQEMTDFEEIAARDLLLGDVLINLRDGMREDNFIDYSLMVRLAVEALQGDPTGPAEGVQHVMVDEYQDVNSVEEALIRELRKRSSTLFVVGDDDQAIYAWRGADVTNILRFEHRYPDCATHTLPHNFRSTLAIVESADAFAHEELGSLRIPKQPTASNPSGPRDFRVLWFGNYSEYLTSIL
jgi:DNA helicase-2/ATP-dependent DNA helicase PcrA